MSTVSIDQAKAGDKHKVVMLGMHGVGKTAIVTSLSRYRSPRKNYEFTIGVEFFTSCINLEDRSVVLEIWDTAGQERFKSITSSYIRSSACVIILYDITRRETFNQIEYWIQEVRKSQGANAFIVIVGNKFDRSDERKVSQAEEQAKAEEVGAFYFCETSAKENHNVKDLFEKVAAVLPENPQVSPNPLVLPTPNPKKTFGCNCS